MLQVLVAAHEHDRCCACSHGIATHEYDKCCACSHSVASREYDKCCACSHGVATYYSYCSRTVVLHMVTRIDYSLSLLVFLEVAYACVSGTTVVFRLSSTTVRGAQSSIGFGPITLPRYHEPIRSQCQLGRALPHILKEVTVETFLL
jgi:hypothetical protein